ncbi:hypothetical protein CFC21_077782 [Triticum aestivum]|uniref:DNA-3-methyladenine glycosylase I n=2 Tax=Triticum aestivum TaxID=4565 RepID=A0A9R1L012_WHEAT|nr:uncharacterized protein LOC123121623 [Triticum aestivum]KAF7072686.1 hypothetical protein CFC21_077782 [Triticum aestivum]
MSAAGPRVAGAARRPSSPRPPSSGAGGRERPPSAGAGGRERPQPTTRRGDEDPRAAADSKASNSKKRLPSAAAAARGALPSMLLRRSELLRRGGKNGNMQSLNVSCASEASDDSFCSRASTGRIGRPAGAAARRRAAGGSSAGPPSARKAASVAPDGAGAAAAVALGSMIGEAAAAPGPPRCPWVTRNTDPCYTAFHDQEWGVPVHDDRKLFEMLVLSGALAEMAWPVILSKRDAFREVFMDFDPLLVSKLNEKKFLGPCSPARSLLSEHRLRTIVENAHELLKIIEEFGSLDEYCWGFLNYKPMVGRYRSPREVPLRTPKAEALSQDLMRRGLRGVGPTVVYAFMQAVGMANDHLATCYRLDECAAAEASDGGHGGTLVKEQEMGKMCGMMIECVSLESSMAAAMISIS